MPRSRRIKPTHLETVVYHCISRTVNKEFLWGELAKEMFIRQMWKVADFCGVQILSYCIMSNHFHILAQVRKEASAHLSNEELLDRVVALYTNEKDQRMVAYFQASLLGSDSVIQDRIRKQLLSRMDDVSQFMKLLKQRYSIWFNHQHHRIGTHWCERFRSVVVENQPSALLAVAAYITLNPVRAGICQDPAQYRHGCLAAAIAGRQQARQAIASLMGLPFAQTPVRQFQELIRSILRGEKRPSPAPECPPKHSWAAQSDAQLLLQKSKQFTSGLVLGNSHFLQKMIDLGQIMRTRQTQIYPLTELSNLACFRKTHSV